METGLPFLDLYITPWLGKIAIALIVFLIGKWVADHLHKALAQLLLKSRFDPTLVKFLGHLSYGFLMIAVVLAALGTIGVDISSLLALIGAAASGVVWLLLQGSDAALTWRELHIVLARITIAAGVLHVLAVASHLLEFARD